MNPKQGQKTVRGREYEKQRGKITDEAISPPFPRSSASRLPLKQNWKKGGRNEKKKERRSQEGRCLRKKIYIHKYICP